MKNSIAYFHEKLIEKLKTFVSYSSDMLKVAEFVHSVTDCTMEFGLRLLEKNWKAKIRFFVRKDICVRIGIS